MIWLVKKRLLTKAFTKEKAFQCFLATTGRNSLFERNVNVSFHILSFLHEYDLDNQDDYSAFLMSQDKQLDELSDHIDALNPNLLPNFANARGILVQPAPAHNEMKYGMGQVWGILNDCHKHLNMLPGLEAWLEQHYQRHAS